MDWLVADLPARLIASAPRASPSVSMLEGGHPTLSDSRMPLELLMQHVCTAGRLQFIHNCPSALIVTQLKAGYHGLSVGCICQKVPSCIF